jgi:hypothetical protein
MIGCAHEWPAGKKLRWASSQQRRVIEQRQRVYRWEQSAWDRCGASGSPRLDQAAAVQALASLWTVYREHGRPLLQDVPALVIQRMKSAALAKVLAHRILIHPNECRLPVLIHEVAHLLLPGTEHGPAWRGLVMRMWFDKWHMSVAESHQLAIEHGIE